MELLNECYISLRVFSASFLGTIGGYSLTKEYRLCDCFHGSLPDVTVTVLLCIFILFFGGIMDDSDILILRTLLASGFSIEVKGEKISLVFCFRCNTAFL